MKHSLFLQQSQKMILSQFMRQGIHLLSLNVLELEEHLENEIDQNPFLIKTSPSSNYTSFDLPSHTSRFSHLMNQAKQVFDENDLPIAENIIGNLDEKGFYREQVASEEEKIVLKTIQTFDPIGIGARSIQEALLLQLTALNKTDSLSYQIIKKYYSEFLHKKWDLILKNLKCKKEDLFDAVYSEISRLNFFPGRGFETSTCPILPPDLVIEKKNTQYKVFVYDPIGFKTIDPYPSCESKEIFTWKNLQIRSISVLINHLKNRKALLTKIGNILIERETLFFEGQGPIEPISSKNLCKELQVHSTTLYRAIYKKYLKCPRGTLPLSLFFKKSVKMTSGKELSSQNLLQKVQSMIHKEDKERPLSDEMIVAKLREQGIKIARRTVAKYRALLNIPATFYRKNIT